MVHYQAIHCPYCNSIRLRKHGKNPNGSQRFRCVDCSKCFQSQYVHKGRKVEINKQIEELTLNGNGVRATARILNIYRDTITSVLKKKLQK